MQSTQLNQFMLTTIVLERSDLIILWVSGVFSNLSYVALALKMQGVTSDKSFDVEAFIDRWAADEATYGKSKILKESIVKAAIEKLKEVEMINTTETLAIEVKF